ncbi:MULTISPECIES: hypothetical protein [Microbacteriaceae]|jgi:hypothetical protein|uniref:Uncharacterized protein n=1 Tax=Leifsonia soli TaxID=582665 RepID=A0A852SVJ7_9MICO|nr:MULTISPECIES: hypothetical protein [Microbacteriaceae]MDR6612520.1 hypothetical protein [Leifsonia sp. 1010]NYD72732.1 hypothetical protein [Leifsonia soli]TDQ02981.1 hypothetical protein AXZ95_1261 [Leifsonia sp. 115AMFTsu3.1]SDH21173.1 hypothetical protein SAMN04515690_1268 [Leifsonia sp. 197AMF]SDJ17486.1 hypothetical protein SAMN04515684_2514 [Leifsonia sp. 466MF]
MARFEPERKRPWIIPAVVVLAVAVIVIGLVVAVAAGGRIF